MIEIKDDGEIEVNCPICNYDYVHHGEVVVYERVDGEDSDTIEKRVDYESEFISYRNPSPRRNAVGINFSCESGHHFDMNVIQHKGKTFIEFEETKTPI